MANYGYGGGYTATTSYGAQGGAEGGGFVAGYGGSQSGSQESPSGTRTYGKETLRPVTIKQIIDATQPHPDAEHKIDGSEVAQLSFIGQINSIQPQATNITFKVEDGTGLIDVKQWIDDGEPDAKAYPTEGQYIHVWGRIKDFNSKRHVSSHVIHPVTDFNEISMHLLEATAVHLYFTRGPPGSGNVAVKSEGMFVDGYGGAANGGAAAGGPIGKKLPATISANARKVYNFMQSAPQNNEGLHVQMIATQVGLGINEIFKAGDELLADAFIFTTVDDETWAVMEY